MEQKNIQVEVQGKNVLPTPIKNLRELTTEITQTSADATVAKALAEVNTEIAADKDYNAADFSGMGRVNLRKNIVDGHNYLTQEMVSKANTIYKIQYDYEIAPTTTEYIAQLNQGTIEVEGNTFNYKVIAVNAGDIITKESGIGNTTAILYMTSDNVWHNPHTPVLTVEDGWTIAIADVVGGSAAVNYNVTTRSITIPENCVLEFEGGSLSGGTLVATARLVIDGYGCLCSLDGVEKIIFAKPYCVSTIHGLKTGANGSPDKPFYYIQDALDVCNNIVIERGSYLWIDQFTAKTPPNIYTGNHASIAKLRYATVIDVYGNGKNPCFAGDFSIPRNSITKVSESTTDNMVSTTWNIDVDVKVGKTNYNENSNNSNLPKIKISDYKPLFLNNGRMSASLHSNSIVQCGNKEVAEILFSRTTNEIIKYYNETDVNYVYNKNSQYFDTFFTLTSISIAQFNYQQIISAHIYGIDCVKNTLVIKNIDFHHLSFGIAHCGNLECQNCNFEWIGGHIQNTITNNETNDFTTYGNAIEGYFVSNDNLSLWNIQLIVSDCIFDKIYDTAFTIQGVNFTSYSARYLGIIKNNIIANTRMGVEFFNTNGTNLFEISVDKNKFINCNSNAEYPWYPNRKQFGAMRLGSVMPNSSSILFTDNEVINSPIYCNTQNGYAFKNFKNNVIFIKEFDYVVRREFVSGPESSSLRVNRANISNIIQSINNLSNNCINNSIVLLNVGVVRGTSQERSSIEYNLSISDIGYPYYDTTINKEVSWDGTKWVESDGAIAGVQRAGTITKRPALADIYAGFMYLVTQPWEDATLGTEGPAGPYYFDGSNSWILADGTSIQDSQMPARS